MMEINANELMARAPEKTEWLVPKRFIDGGLNLLVGEVAAGKTFLALDLALGVAERGTAWGGLDIPRGQVLYYCLDSSPNMIAQRLKGLCQKDGLTPPKALMFDFGRHDFYREQEIDLLIGKILANRTRLVIFDVLARYLDGINENSISMISPLMTRMRAICDETKASILFIHHFNKHSSVKEIIGNRVRGSSDIFASVDVAMGAMVKGEERELRVIKNRFGKPAEPLKFVIADEGWLDFHPVVLGSSAMPTMAEVTTEQVVSMLRALPGKYYPRKVIEEMLADFFGLPSKRTLDDVFAGLGDEEDIRVGVKDKVKYYGYFREDGTPMMEVEDESGQDESYGQQKEKLIRMLKPLVAEMKRKKKEKEGEQVT